MDNTTQESVLVIYDLLSDLASILSLLQENGYLVQTKSYRQARATKTLKDPPDLILLDRRDLEGEDREWVNQFCLTMVSQQIPLMTITTLEDLVDNYQFYLSHNIDYLIDPLSSEEFLFRIASHLKKIEYAKHLQEQEQKIAQEKEVCDRLQKQLYRLHNRIQDTYQLQRDMMDQLNHQLRTPLHGILGHIQILSQDQSLTAQQQEHLQSIQACSYDLLTTMTKILNRIPLTEDTENGGLTAALPSGVEQSLNAWEIPPGSELTLLYQAAKIGDIDRIEQESLRLKALSPHYHIFADRILSLAKGFEDTKIVELIQRYAPAEKQVS